MSLVARREGTADISPDYYCHAEIEASETPTPPLEANDKSSQALKVWASYKPDEYQASASIKDQLIKTGPAPPYSSVYLSVNQFSVSSITGATLIYSASPEESALVEEEIKTLLEGSHRLKEMRNKIANGSISDFRDFDGKFLEELLEAGKIIQETDFPLSDEDQKDIDLIERVAQQTLETYKETSEIWIAFIEDVINKIPELNESNNPLKNSLQKFKEEGDYDSFTELVRQLNSSEEGKAFLKDMLKATKLEEDGSVSLNTENLSELRKLATYSLLRSEERDGKSATKELLEFSATKAPNETAKFLDKNFGLEFSKQWFIELNISLSIWNFMMEIYEEIQKEEEERRKEEEKKLEEKRQAELAEKKRLEAQRTAKKLLAKNEEEIRQARAAELKRKIKAHNVGIECAKTDTIENLILVKSLLTELNVAERLGFNTASDQLKIQESELQNQLKRLRQLDLNTYTKKALLKARPYV